MGKKSGSAPQQDPNVGIAALKSAEIGEDYLSFMKDQAKVTNQWAAEDRTRHQTVYKPLEDQMIREAQDYTTPGRTNQRVNQAQADARFAAASGQKQLERSMAAMGVKPGSGRYDDGKRRSETAEALAVAGSGNVARRQVRAEGDAKMANVVNMGRGMAVNPGQSMSLSNSAVSAGSTGAMQGYGQQANILQTDYGQRMDAYNASQASSGALWGAVGQVAGAAFFSDENAKEGKTEARGVLDAVRKMRVDNWKYKKGQGDEGQHIGTYAQDFQKETGLGDGKSIPAIDAVGVTMGAIKELDEKVTKMARSMGVKEAA